MTFSDNIDGLEDDLENPDDDLGDDEEDDLGDDEEDDDGDESVE